MSGIMKIDTLDKRFSIERVALLLRNRGLEDAPTIGVAVAVLAALNLVSLLFGRAPFMNSDFGRHTAWPAIVAIGGILLASRAFAAMHDGRSGPEWLLLPASSAEKYVSALIAYLLLYPVVATTIAWLLSAALALIGGIAGTGSYRMWNPSASFSSESAVGYLTFAVIAIAGSARFRKFAIGKTAAVCATWTIALTLLGAFILFVLSPEARQLVFNGGKFNIRIAADGMGQTAVYLNNVELAQDASRTFLVIEELFRWVSILFAASYGFALVTEKEARDEVQ